MLPVATAIHHGVYFKVTPLCCDLSQGQDLEDLFHEDGEFFATYKKNVICRRIVEKKKCSFEKIEEPEKDGKKAKG